MRKVLIALLSILILALTIYVIIEGISFVNVNGYKEITVINRELDIKIMGINRIKDVEYINKQRTLDQETKALKDVREDYLAKVEAARLKGAKGSKLQIEIYELDFIWARIGNYASELGLEIRLDVFSGTEDKPLNGFKLYNLKISVIGAYTDIVRFIYKIEGDRQIAARLSDFSMNPAGTISTEAEDSADGESEEDTEDSGILSLNAEFSLKNIPLNYKNILEDSAPNREETSIKDVKEPGDETEETPPVPKVTDETDVKNSAEDAESILGR